MKRVAVSGRVRVIGLLALAIALSTVLGSQVVPVDAAQEKFTTEFRLEECTFSSVGGNPYFILTPGYTLLLRGRVDGERVELTITVLNETKVVDGVVTRVVEERETADGDLVEVSRNYFAMCQETNN